MILNRFFKPKWQHSNPEVRIQALQNLSISDPAVIQAARDDQNPSVRRAILHRLNDLNLLREIARQDPEIGVRETAEARFRKLMTGREPDSPDLHIRLNALLQSVSPNLAEFLVTHAREPKLRAAALQEVNQDTLLGEIASHDPAAEVRLAAVERIREESTLKQVVKQTLKRDKRVHRLARERLEALKAQREQAARSEQLCTEMETLAGDLTREPDAGRFQKLEQAWRIQESAADIHIKERYRQAREEFLERLHEGAARRRQRVELCHTLEQLLNRLQTETELSAELTAVIENTLQDIHLQQPESAVPAETEVRLSQLAQAIRDRERVLHRNHERAQRLRELLQTSDALLHQASEVQERELVELKKLWGSLERPEASSMVADLQIQFDAALGRLHARVQRQEAQRDQEREEIESLVGSVEQALAQGALQQAISLHQRARQRLKHNISLSRKQMATLEGRLQACTPHMGELRDWRRWGTNRSRENLCEEVEGLIGLAKDPIEIAQRVKRTRSAWKTLDGSEGAAPKSLWERFNGACERAYEPCQTYFEAKARERRENLEKRQVVCDDLEQCEANTDWDHPDWRSVEQFRRKIQAQWRNIGPVNRADKKALDRRYIQALERLDVHLDQERERDLHRRQAMIHRVRQLVDSEDLGAAIAATKQIQAEWQPTVQSSRRKEQELWREFRGACDAVFERRQAEREAADAERQANLAQKTALCEQIEALMPANDETIGQARKRIQQIQQEWESIGPVPKTTYQQIEQRFARDLQQFEQRCQDRQHTHELRELQILRDKTRLCSRIEALLAAEHSDGPVVVEQARQEWTSLPGLSKSLEEPVRGRFDAVCQAVIEGGQARQSVLRSLEANLESKKILCLRLEILAGVETPPEFAQDRMEYQVARLSESMAEPSSMRLEQKIGNEAREIEHQWYLLGSLPSELDQVLEARVERALAALYKARE